MVVLAAKVVLLSCGVVVLAMLGVKLIVWPTIVSPDGADWPSEDKKLGSTLAG